MAVNAAAKPIPIGAEPIRSVVWWAQRADGSWRTNESTKPVWLSARADELDEPRLSHAAATPDGANATHAGP